MISECERYVGEVEVTCADDGGPGRERRRSRRQPPVNANAPVLVREGYFTVPDIRRLRRMSDDELQVRLVFPSSPALEYLFQVFFG